MSSWLTQLVLRGIILVAVMAVVAAAMIGAIGLLRAVGRRFGTSAATIQLPWWLIIGLVGGLTGVTLLLGQQQLFALLIGYLAVSLSLTLGYSWFRQRDSPIGAIRRMNAGDHAGAIAELRARVERQRITLGGAIPAGASPDRGAPGDDFNPFAAPSAGVATVTDRVRLVHDLNTLGVVESNRGAWAEALVAYDEAIALADDAPIAPILRGNRAYALVELGRPDEGLPLLRAAIAELAPADRWARAQFLTALADKLLDHGQTAEVAALLDRARREGRRERVYPRAGKRAWLARLDDLGSRLAAGQPEPVARGDPL